MYAMKYTLEYVRDHINEIDWKALSKTPGLSEEIIREFADKVDWKKISIHQRLSEPFIREFADRLDWWAWWAISKHQCLSEAFIREFADKVNWWAISVYQRLSEPFIQEFADRVSWPAISKFQPLSKRFIRDHADIIDIEAQHRKHRKKSYQQKLHEVIQYAQKHNLKYNKKYLYAFRNHDEYGRGSFNTTIIYKPGIYYRDWRCDMDENEENSFGYGIWPKGNTPVRVKISDWGMAVKYDPNGKARVWGFEIIESGKESGNVNKQD